MMTKTKLRISDNENSQRMHRPKQSDMIAKIDYRKRNKSRNKFLLTFDDNRVDICFCQYAFNKYRGLLFKKKTL